MNKEPGVSVEIFRDSSRKKLSTEAAEAGIDIVRQIATGVKIMKTTRLLTIAKSEQGFVDMAKIRWPKFDADLNVIVTDRPIFPPDMDRSDPTDDWLQAYLSGVMGISQRLPGLGSTRVAVIDTQISSSTENVTAHEVGHLLNLKKQGETWDNESHCSTQECTMRPRLGGGEEFCNECTQQLGQSAFYFQKAKAGETVPEEWY